MASFGARGRLFKGLRQELRRPRPNLLQPDEALVSQSPVDPAGCSAPAVSQGSPGVAASSASSRHRQSCQACAQASRLQRARGPPAANLEDLLTQDSGLNNQTIAEVARGGPRPPAPRYMAGEGPLPVPPAYRNKLRYSVTPDAIRSPAVRERFVELSYDRTTKDFLDWCESQREEHALRTACIFSVIRPLLSSWLSHSDLNAFLNVGLMHLLSTAQILQLLQASKWPALAEVRDQLRAGPAGPADEGKEAAAEAGRPGGLLRADRGRPVWLLDIGAGSGRITQQFVPFADTIVATEVSEQMINRLRERGFRAIHTSDIRHLEEPQLDEDYLGAAQGALPPDLVDRAAASSSADPGIDEDDAAEDIEAASAAPPAISPPLVPLPELFDLVLCLNVIDRCMRPKTLLRDIRDRLRPVVGRAVVAVPLPLNPAVEISQTKKWVDPEEIIRPPGQCYQCELNHAQGWERAVSDLVLSVVEPAGLEVLSLSRVPYLSQGDQHTTLYSLDDVVLVCARKD